MGLTNKPVKNLGFLPLYFVAVATKEGIYLNRFEYLYFFFFFLVLGAKGKNGGINGDSLYNESV